MANEQQRRLMQQALDEQLTPEAQAELRAQLDTDVRATDEFERLQRVDHTLRSAPLEHAPARLALNIMARLARDLNPEQLSHLAGLALALGLALITLVALPLLLSISYLILSVVGSAAGLSGAVHTLVSALALIIAVLEAFVQRLQELLGTYPATPLLFVALIPLSLAWLLRSLSQRRAA